VPAVQTYFRIYSKSALSFTELTLSQRRLRRQTPNSHLSPSGGTVAGEYCVSVSCLRRHNEPSLSHKHDAPCTHDMPCSRNSPRGVCTARCITSHAVSVHAADAFKKPDSAPSHCVSVLLSLAGKKHTDFHNIGYRSAVVKTRAVRDRISPPIWSGF